MKEEAKRWLTQAKEELDTAEVDFKAGKYFAAAFWCQQAVEKSFKALMLKKTGKIRKIHDLVELAKSIGFPEEKFKAIRELTLAYVYARYPDVIKTSNLKDKASYFLQVTKEILKWVEENL